MLIIEQAYAKINLVLDVLNKRADNYHEVKMVMQTIDLCDDVEISSHKDLQLTVVGADLPNDQRNIAYKAAQLMAKYAEKQPAVHIKIEKRIPLAAGLAGGSADAAAVLRGLNKFWQLNWEAKKLEQIAAELGSDVPFCICGGTALATGRGEIITALPDCPKVDIALACPDVEVSTAWVYKNYDRKLVLNPPNVDIVVKAVQEKNLPAIINYLNNNTGNVLEFVTIKEYPIVAQIKATMLDKGATVALMSGSGPSVFSFVPNREIGKIVIKEIKDRIKARTWLTKTKGRLEIT